VPLSPILFGLFIEQLQAKLKSECPTIGGFIFNGDHLKDITFADDIIFMTYNQDDMSTLLVCLQRFCAEYHMSPYERTPFLPWIWASNPI
jgi:hypothetical protein